MSTAATSLSAVPKLDTSGVNWPIISVRFHYTIDAKGFRGHFDETTPCPVSAVVPVVTVTGPVALAAQPATAPRAAETVISPVPTVSESPILFQWLKNEHLTKSLLTQKIPDSVPTLVRTQTTIK